MKCLMQEFRAVACRFLKSVSVQHSISLKKGKGRVYRLGTVE